MANLIINLPQLQDKIKRDPTGYKVRLLLAWEIFEIISHHVG